MLFLFLFYFKCLKEKRKVRKNVKTLKSTKRKEKSGGFVVHGKDVSARMLLTF